MNPKLKKGVWSVEEDEQLLQLYESIGSKWNIIADKMQSRSDIQCRYEFLKIQESLQVTEIIN